MMENWKYHYKKTNEIQLILSKVKRNENENEPGKKDNKENMRLIWLFYFISEVK